MLAILIVGWPSTIIFNNSNDYWLLKYIEYVNYWRYNNSN